MSAGFAEPVATDSPAPLTSAAIFPAAVTTRRPAPSTLRCGRPLRFQLARESGVRYRRAQASYLSLSGGGGGFSRQTAISVTIKADRSSQPLGPPDPIVSFKRGRGNIMQRRLLNTALLISVCIGAAVAQTAVQARLEEYRAQIDGVDRQIVELLNKRAAIVQRIGSVKKEAGLAVAAPAREQQVLDRVAEAGKTGPLPPATVRRIYEAILREMRTWEATGNAEKQ